MDRQADGQGECNTPFTLFFFLEGGTDHLETTLTKRLMFCWLTLERGGVGRRVTLVKLFPLPPLSTRPLPERSRSGWAYNLQAASTPRAEGDQQKLFCNMLTHIITAEGQCEQFFNERHNRLNQCWRTYNLVFTYYLFVQCIESLWLFLCAYDNVQHIELCSYSWDIAVYKIHHFNHY